MISREAQVSGWNGLDVEVHTGVRQSFRVLECFLETVPAALKLMSAPQVPLGVRQQLPINFRIILHWHRGHPACKLVPVSCKQNQTHL